MFCAEEESSWTTVRNSSADHNTNFIRPSTSFADAVRGNPLTGANAIPVQTRQQEKKKCASSFVFSGQSTFNGSVSIKGKAIRDLLSMPVRRSSKVGMQSAYSLFRLLAWGTCCSELS
jgi:hypothetical protein